MRRRRTSLRLPARVGERGGGGEGVAVVYRGGWGSHRDRMERVKQRRENVPLTTPLLLLLPSSSLLSLALSTPPSQHGRTRAINQTWKVSITHARTCKQTHTNTFFSFMALQLCGRVVRYGSKARPLTEKGASKYFALSLVVWWVAHFVCHFVMRWSSSLFLVVSYWRCYFSSWWLSCWVVLQVC